MTPYFLKLFQPTRRRYKELYIDNYNILFIDVFLHNFHFAWCKLNSLGRISSLYILATSPRLQQLTYKQISSTEILIMFISYSIIYISLQKFFGHHRQIESCIHISHVRHDFTSRSTHTMKSLNKIYIFFKNYMTTFRNITFIHTLIENYSKSRELWWPLVARYAYQA
jgi:hypothetical protein